MCPARLCGAPVRSPPGSLIAWLTRPLGRGCPAGKFIAGKVGYRTGPAPHIVSTSRVRVFVVAAQIRWIAWSTFISHSRTV
jgi:hypothetical protein